MGGDGSGRWHEHQKAAVTADCLPLDTGTFRRDGIFRFAAASGTIAWDRDCETVLSAMYSLERRSTGRVLRLQYSLGSDSPVTEVVPITTTTPRFGGIRHWFRCPGCGHSVCKLFLPPGASEFRCRRCSRLSYRSCQQSHTALGMLRHLVRLLELG
jgi:hypothetical protein